MISQIALIRFSFGKSFSEGKNQRNRQNPIICDFFFYLIFFFKLTAVPYFCFGMTKNNTYSWLYYYYYG